MSSTGGAGATVPPPCSLSDYSVYFFLVLSALVSPLLASQQRLPRVMVTAAAAWTGSKQLIFHAATSILWTGSASNCLWAPLGTFGATALIVWQVLQAGGRQWKAQPAPTTHLFSSFLCWPIGRWSRSRMGVDLGVLSSGQWHWPPTAAPAAAARQPGPGRGHTRLWMSFKCWVLSGPEHSHCAGRRRPHPTAAHPAHPSLQTYVLASSSRSASISAGKAVRSNETGCPPPGQGAKSWERGNLHTISPRLPSRLAPPYFARREQTDWPPPAPFSSLAGSPTLDVPRKFLTG